MGEYEDRYPDAYGRDESIGAATADPRIAETPPATPQPRPRPLLERLGLGGAGERARTWQHGPAAPEHVPGAQYVPSSEAAAVSNAIPPETPALHRGRGPRGYTRSVERIREDFCDRLTENPFVDASDIEVTVSGSEIVLTGTVDSEIALRQTQQIAEEVIGVSRVDNRLVLRAEEEGHPTPGERVDAAMSPLPRRPLFRR